MNNSSSLWIFIDVRWQCFGCVLACRLHTINISHVNEYFKIFWDVNVSHANQYADAHNKFLTSWIFIEIKGFKYVLFKSISWQSRNNSFLSRDCEMSLFKMQINMQTAHSWFINIYRDLGQLFLSVKMQTNNNNNWIILSSNEYL